MTIESSHPQNWKVDIGKYYMRVLYYLTYIARHNSQGFQENDLHATVLYQDWLKDI